MVLAAAMNRQLSKKRFLLNSSLRESGIVKVIWWKGVAGKMVWSFAMNLSVAFFRRNCRSGIYRYWG